ncbi:MAG: MobF family relaxase, partial [Actinomycetota bacterium]
TGDDLRAILAGLAPGTGLSPNGTQIRPFKNRVPGFDLTFSAPKSVSVMYAFADPIVRADITAAVDNAVAESLAWLEREACFVRRGSNNKRAKTPAFEKWGTRRLAGAGFIAAGFRHRTSRAGDPQLHTHVLVANLTRGPDGKWSALDGQALYRSKLAAGVVFQTALRNELTVRLGVRWRPAHEHVADIAGIPQRVLTHFSKRRNEIEDELERTGQSGPAAAAHATLATRTAKVEIDHETLDQRWADDGSTIGFGSDDINRLLRGNQPRTAVRDLTADSKLAMREIDPITGEVREVIVSIDQFASIVAHGLPERNATVTRLDVQNAIADHLLGNGDSAFLERLTDAVLADPELVLIPPPDNADQTGWEQLWTTRRMLRIEADIRSIVTPISQPRHSLPAVSVEQSLAAVGQALGPDQADTVRRLCTQGLDVEVVVGRAGTGKTYTMNAVRQVLDTHGKRLLGVCPTARAARELADGAHIDTFTIPRLFSQTNLTSNDVLVVDEAGMCGTLDLHRLLLHARERGTQVILVGDHRQLPEVTAGGGFAAALDAVGVRRCELTVNRRQIQTWEHAALDHLRDGDVTTFWHTFNDNGRVHLEANREALHANAIDAWWRDHTAGHDAHLIAGTRSEARLLNRMARERAAAADQLTGPELAIRDRSFQVGDRIVLLSNDANQTDRTTGQRSRVDNGMIATVIQIDHRTGALDVQVASTDQRIGLTPDYVHSGSIDHGYATTIHKAQGVTCDHIHVVGPAGLYREAAYVALSRARRSAHLYATTDEAATIGERGHTTGIPLASENLDDPEADLTRAISTSRAKRFVTADHPSLAHIADLASRCDLGELRRRRRRVLAVITQLEAQGVDDPRQEAERHRLATEHRQHMHVGERVNARDWDNVGTVQRLHDLTGQASVRFV